MQIPKDKLANSQALLAEQIKKSKPSDRSNIASPSCAHDTAQTSGITGVSQVSNPLEVHNLAHTLTTDPSKRTSQTKRTDYESEDFFDALFNQSPFKSNISVSQDGTEIIEQAPIEPVIKNPGEIEIKGEVGYIKQFILDQNHEVIGAVFLNHEDCPKILIKNLNSQDDITKWDVALETSDYIDEARYSSLKANSSTSKIFILDPTEDKIQLVEIDRNNPTKKRVVSKDENFDLLDVSFNPITEEPEAIKVSNDYKEWKPVCDQSLMSEHLDFLSNAGLGVVDIVSRNDKNNSWVVSFAGSDKPPSYYVYKPQQKELTLIKKDNPDLEQFELAKTIPFTYAARDGETIHAFLTVPPNKSLENLPLIVNVHGGPESSEDASWRGPDTQWAACRLGCAEVKVNFRGSSGRGEEFEKKGHGEWGQKMQDDLVDLVNHLKSIEIDGRRLVNLDKIAIAGFSYGGYAALVGAMKNSNIFRCAVSMEPVTDLTIGFGGGTKTRREKVIVGDPERGDKERQKLEDNSPAFHIDEIKMPTYIQWGLGVGSIGKSHAKSFVDALKIESEFHESNNFTVRLFPGEDHVPGVENNKVLKRDVELFLREHLIGM